MFDVLFAATITKKTLSCIAVLALACACITIAHAQSIGDLLVAPTRVVFDGKQRTTELTLINIGKAAATYRISFIHQRMTEAGALQDIDKPLEGELFADDLVRFTPRQITLEPRVAQTVRLQLKKPAELPVGEYRSHLLFRAVPVEQPDASLSADTAKTAEGISIKLTPIYGVSIPVIIRHGDTSAKIVISDMQLRPASGTTELPVLAARFNRTGNQSTYGDLTVVFSPDGGAAKQVAKINGVAVYTPNASRLVQLSIQVPKDMELKKGRLTLTYAQKPEDGGNVWAESSLDLP